jgi:hypothetical protein
MHDLLNRKKEKKRMIFFGVMSLDSANAMRLPDAASDASCQNSLD